MIFYQNFDLSVVSVLTNEWGIAVETLKAFRFSGHGSERGRRQLPHKG